MANRYLVDIPDPSDLEGSWHEIGDFDTRAKAIAFVKKIFGGDAQGRICLVSEVPDELAEEMEDVGDVFTDDELEKVENSP